MLERSNLCGKPIWIFWAMLPHSRFWTRRGEFTAAIRHSPRNTSQRERLWRTHLLRQAVKFTDIFLNTEFEGGRHERRIAQIAAIENGEDIIGYQYLHGTNSNVGGFHIAGSIQKTSNGKVLYSLSCTWNDLIDPNPMYTSDKKKARLAEWIPFANPTDYKISISWRYTNMSLDGGARNGSLTKAVHLPY